MDDQWGFLTYWQNQSEPDYAWANRNPWVGSQAAIVNTLTIPSTGTGQGATAGSGVGQKTFSFDFALNNMQNQDTKVWLSGNRGPGISGPTGQGQKDGISWVTSRGGATFPRPIIWYASEPSWYSAMNFMTISADNVADYVFAQAGARPLDRDSLDVTAVTLRGPASSATGRTWGRASPHRRRWADRSRSRRTSGRFRFPQIRTRSRPDRLSDQYRGLAGVDGASVGAGIGSAERAAERAARRAEGRASHQGGVRARFTGLRNLLISSLHLAGRRGEGWGRLGASVAPSLWPVCAARAGRAPGLHRHAEQSGDARYTQGGTTRILATMRWKAAAMRQIIARISTRSRPGAYADVGAGYGGRSSRLVGELREAGLPVTAASRTTAGRLMTPMVAVHPDRSFRHEDFLAGDRAVRPRHAQ